MLSSETKRKIDNARDILVGKIPVPSAQIELITIALVYKFMSDIDSQNKELWWAGFFVGDYEKYSRSQLMDRKLGAHDRLYLYSEWLDKMGTNPHLPQMFRDIFRNAFLPFKDPQTLDRFLKQINEFSYDHSEELGNAFEYLLSTAGSQWDAGQFRTPRHIIDFTVDVVEPKHTDSILDPACGTAWFLISAYKYILQSNTEKTIWDKLTLAQKNKLTDNFVGYDISHEMVRLSLVNLYLHNFWDPKIFEYDTLSSDERRDDRFDCILANPPFMTPKGGIQPHSRFSIKASKSEVLFVDYMMEHLNPQGKAWIIVPEGIIFQSATAYKSLRKKMIEDNYLRAVISLPSGVFQPYSGVKTSILLFDKELAKKSQNILFVKVNQDGYDLWAQRRPTPDKNDLPKVLEDILLYKQWIQADKEPLPLDHSFLLVPKSDIIDNGDYNLSMERYRTSELVNSDWPMVELRELVDITTWRKDVNQWNPEWEYPFFTCAKEHTFSNEYSFDTEALLIAGNGDVWAVKYFKGKFEAYQRTYVLNNFKWVLPKYLFKCLDIKLKETVSKQKLWNTMPYIKLWMLQDFKIPLPPLEVQEQIVAELDGYQKIIDWAKQIVENYKPTIKINSDWEMVELGEVADFSQWTQVDLERQIKEPKDWYIRFWRIIDFTQNVEWDERFVINPWEKYCIKENDIVMVRYWATAWFVGTGKRWALANNLFKIDIDNNKFDNKFIYHYLKDEKIQKNIFQMAWWWAMQALSFSIMKKVKVPNISLEAQQQIVAEIEKEQAMVESAKELIEVFEGKVKEKIGEVWGE